jgi:hypothetical protein
LNLFCVNDVKGLKGEFVCNRTSELGAGVTKDRERATGELCSDHRQNEAFAAAADESCRAVALDGFEARRIDVGRVRCDERDAVASARKLVEGFPHQQLATVRRRVGTLCRNNQDPQAVRIFVP